MYKDIGFSVVVPVYNAVNCIIDCLESVRHQSFNNFEIIIVNDGSKDGSDEIIRQYISKNTDMKIIYKNQENAGPAKARGNGIKYATKSHIAFLDADDIWYADKLKVSKEIIERTGATFIYSNEYVVELDGNKKMANYYSIGVNGIEDIIVRGNPISTSTVVVESNLLKMNHTFLDGNECGEDVACWIALAVAGAHFHYIDKPLGEYRRTSTSLTLSNEEYVIATGERLLRLCDYLLDCGYTTEKVEKLKDIQRAINLYNYGRYFQKNGMFDRAKDSYMKSMEIKIRFRTIAGYILSCLRIRR